MLPLGGYVQTVAGSRGCNRVTVFRKTDMFPGVFVVSAASSVVRAPDPVMVLLKKRITLARRAHHVSHAVSGFAIPGARPGDHAGSGSPVTWLTGQPSQKGPQTAHLLRARPPEIRNGPLVVPPGTSKYPIAVDPLRRMATSDDRPAGTSRDFIGPSRAWAPGLRKQCTVGVRQPALQSRVLPPGFDIWDSGIDAVVRQTRGEWIFVRCACIDNRKIL